MNRSEARIPLEQREIVPGIPVGCLSLVDRFAEKLLANADRWPDESVECRDLIDLAMMRGAAPVPQVALSKAASAYPVVPPLQRAIEAFEARPELRARCFRNLQIDDAHAAQIIEGIALLAQDVSRLSGAAP